MNIEFDLRCTDSNSHTGNTEPRSLSNVLNQLEENCFVVKKRYHATKSVKEREYNCLLKEYKDICDGYNYRLSELNVIIQNYKLQFANILNLRQRYKQLFAQIGVYGPGLCIKAYDYVREIFDNNIDAAVDLTNIDPRISELVSDILEGKYGYFDTEIFDIWRDYCTYNPITEKVVYTNDGNNFDTTTSGGFGASFEFNKIDPYRIYTSDRTEDPLFYDGDDIRLDNDDIIIVIDSKICDGSGNEF